MHLYRSVYILTLVSTYRYVRCNARGQTRCICLSTYIYLSTGICIYIYIIHILILPATRCKHHGDGCKRSWNHDSLIMLPLISRLGLLLLGVLPLPSPHWCGMDLPATITVDHTLTRDAIISRNIWHRGAGPSSPPDFSFAKIQAAPSTLNTLRRCTARSRLWTSSLLCSIGSAPATIGCP